MNNKIIFGVVLLLIIFISDRNIWMEDRVKQLWIWESGVRLGEPIAYEKDFIIKNSFLIFKPLKKNDNFRNINRLKENKHYLLGCYFGKLYLLDTKSKKVTIYFEKG